jgi:copper(I)-binding protein
MAALQSLPVPADDSVLFAPLGAHVMLTRLTRTIAAGDTVALTLTFVSGQSLEVRAGVRKP